jgi:hypothetical protein
MRLQRISDRGDNTHRGKAFMVLVCKDEAELDAMQEQLNKVYGWGNQCSFCTDDGNDMSWFVCTDGGDNSDLAYFKDAYKKAKKAIK